MPLAQMVRQFRMAMVSEIPVGLALIILRPDRVPPLPRAESRYGLLPVEGHNLLARKENYMPSNRYFRAGDQPTRRADNNPRENIDLSPLVGTWVNTKKDTGGFAKLIITERAGRLFLRAYAACAPELCDWGEVEAFAYSDSVDSHTVQAMSAFLDVGFADVTFQGNLNLGLLVLVTFNHFKDNTERTSYICREFYHRLSPSPPEV
ncbi:MAG: hypothetical protein QOJ70_3461 [Acidobacteriota bacterium]|jgi:hypothetical protein|nr:hypothetical protein [Acidobacteriota bacterium]